MSLRRKEAKKSGQPVLVKLVPKLLSNGFGKGELEAELLAVSTEAVEEAEECVMEVTVVGVEEMADVLRSIEWAAVEMDELDEDVEDSEEPKESEFPRRRRLFIGNGGCRSKRMFSLLSNLPS